MTPITRRLSFLLGAAAGPAFAQTAPPPPVTLSGSAALVSDYRLRGLSRTSRGPAAQASIAIATLAGSYVSVWATTIGGYVARGGDAEVDLTAGYRTTLGSTTIDGGLLYYVYPGHGAGETNVAEPFISASRSYGPLTGKIGGALAWRQRALGLVGDRRGGEYLYGELAVGIPRTPVSITAHIGHSFTANAMTLGQRYTDWSIGGSYSLRALTFGLSYVDTDAQSFRLTSARIQAPRNAAGATVVGSVAIAF